MNAELNDPNSIAIEATDDQPAVTRGELVALHEEQMRQIHQEENDPDAPAIENEDGYHCHQSGIVRFTCKTEARYFKV